MNREIKLTERLQAVADSVDTSFCTADIGTDHGLLPNYLIENKKASYVIATDISRPSLQKNIEYTLLRGNEKFIESRLGDGLEPLKIGEVDTCIIAGMGGVLIKDILNSSMEKVRSIDKFVLQPMTASKELREYLYDYGFTIEKEKLVREGNRFYEIMTVIHGVTLLDDEIFLEFGKNIIKERPMVFFDYLKMRIRSNEKLLYELENKAGDKVEDRIAKLKIETLKFKELYNGNKYK
ncbi:MAG: class I SAM-dependent methyltransferase [Tissierellia bacterium]|nr:class I SAM-dependent methyltransferase [Tissierellia bacterium]